MSQKNDTLTPGTGDHEEKKTCPVVDCVYASDCEILRIMGRAPSQARKCSYFEKPKQGKKKSLDAGSSDEL